MEFHSAVYEVHFRCEEMGMRLKNWDLMPEDALLKECQKFLGVANGRD